MEVAQKKERLGPEAVAQLMKYLTLKQENLNLDAQHAHNASKPASQQVSQQSSKK